MPRKPRDIYKGRFEKGFDINRDVDLAHLREIMAMQEVDNANYNYYGLYIQNIINIMLNSYHFRGYDDEVKHDILTEGMIDALKARTKFDGAKYPQPSAPFNYIYRVCFHSAQHVLTNFYKMQNRMVPASQCGNGTKFSDGDDYDEDILNKALTDWDAVAEHLQDNPTVTTGCSPSDSCQ